MRAAITLALLAILQGCGGDSATRPPVPSETTREDPPAEDAPEENQDWGEPVTLLGATLPPGIVALSLARGPAVEALSSEVQWATSRRPLSHIVREMGSSLGESFRQEGTAPQWQSSDENTSVRVQVFPSGAREVQHLQNVSEGTRSIIRIARETRSPCDCNFPRPGCRCSR